MAKDTKSTYNEQRYFDIVPANRNMPQSTSRPVVVTNHPEQSDPMVKNPPANSVEDNVDGGIESPPPEDKLPDDITIDSESEKPENVSEAYSSDEKVNNNEPVPEPEKLLTENPLLNIDPDEPLLPAHASPDVPATTVNMLQPTSKNYKWLWIVAIIVILLIAVIAAVSYILLS